MEINIDNITGFVYQVGQGLGFINDHSSIVTLDDSQQQAWENSPPNAGAYFNNGSFTYLPWVSGIPSTVSTETMSTYKEQVMLALQNNIGKTVTADTVQSLLQYLGNLP